MFSKNITNCKMSDFNISAEIDSKIVPDNYASAKMHPS